jgi:hypothetical protein
MWKFGMAGQANPESPVNIQKVLANQQGMKKTLQRFELAAGKQPNEKFRLGNWEIAGGRLGQFQTS